MLTVFLTIVLFVLQMLDTYTTTTIDDLDGIKNNNEDNDLPRWLFKKFGRNTVLNIKTVAVTGIGFYLGTQEYLVGDVVMRGLWLEFALIAWYAYIVFVYNWRSMPK